MPPRGKLELTWVGKDERPRLEPRVLVEDPARSCGDPNSGNMLIFGNNLLAPKSLEQDFAGRSSAFLSTRRIIPDRPDSSMNETFLLALVLGEHFSRFAESVSMRSGFPKVNREEFAEHRAALPRRDEQDRVALVFDARDARIRAEEAYRDKLKLVKKRLMHDLLTGKVRVKA